MYQAQEDHIFRQFNDPLATQVILRDLDLRAYIDDICNSDLPSMREVKVIKVERCKIERFVPR